jgi:hypothetical protein
MSLNITAKNRKAAAAAAAAAAKPAPLTAEQQRASWEAYVSRRAEALVTNTDSVLAEARSKVTESLAAGYVLDTYHTKRLVTAEARAGYVARYLKATPSFADIPELLRRVGMLRAELTRVVMSAANGMGDCGEVNSTCAVTRAFAMLRVSAAAELLRDTDVLAEAPDFN